MSLSVKKNIVMIYVREVSLLSENAWRPQPGLDKPGNYGLSPRLRGDPCIAVRHKWADDVCNVIFILLLKQAFNY